MEKLFTFCVGLVLGSLKLFWFGLHLPVCRGKAVVGLVQESFLEVWGGFGNPRCAAEAVFYEVGKEK